MKHEETVDGESETIRDLVLRQSVSNAHRSGFQEKVLLLIPNIPKIVINSIMMPLSLQVILLLLGLVQLVVGQNLIFNRTALGFDSSQGSMTQSVSFQLSAAPSGQVSVQVQSGDSNLFIVQSPWCTLLFTPLTWNVTQQVAVSAVPRSFTSNSVVNSVLNFNTNYQQGNTTQCFQATQSLPLIQNTRTSRTCAMTNLAFTSFDGEKFLFKDQPQSYYLMNSPETSVQILTYDCFQPTSFCTERVAIRHYDSYVVFTAPAFSSGPVVPTFNLQNPSNPLIQVLATRGQDAAYTVTLADGSRIDLQEFSNPPIGFNFWNVQITAIGNYFGRTSGLCGNNEGAALNDALYQSAININRPFVPVTDNIAVCGRCSNPVRPSFSVCTTTPPSFCGLVPITNTTTTTAAAATTTATRPVTISTSLPVTTGNATATTLMPTQTPTSAANCPVLALNPAAIQFDDASLTVPQMAAVSLQSQPANEVRVSVTIDAGFVASPCTLTFTRSNWNQPQQISIRAKPLSSSQDRMILGQVYFNITSQTGSSTPSCVTCSQTMPLSRRARKTSSCSIRDNGATTSFDGENIVFGEQAGADYYMMRSTETVVQVSKAQCPQPQAGLCVSRVGIRHFDSTFTVSTNVNAPRAGVFQMSSTQMSNPAEQLITAIANANRYTVTLSDGTIVNISGDVSSYFNVEIIAPGSYFNRVQGICGNFDGVKMSDAQYLNDLRANQPFVPASDSIFTCGKCTAAPRPPNVLTDCQPQQLPNGFCPSSPIYTPQPPTRPYNPYDPTQPIKWIDHPNPYVPNPFYCSPAKEDIPHYIAPCPIEPLTQYHPVYTIVVVEKPAPPPYSPAPYPIAPVPVYPPYIYKPVPPKPHPQPECPKPKPPKCRPRPKPTCKPRPKPVMSTYPTAAPPQPSPAASSAPSQSQLPTSETSTSPSPSPPAQPNNSGNLFGSRDPNAVNANSSENVQVSRTRERSASMKIGADAHVSAVITLFMSLLLI